MVCDLFFVLKKINGVEPGLNDSGHSVTSHVSHFLESCISIMLIIVSILIPSQKNFPPHFLCVVNLTYFT